MKRWIVAVLVVTVLSGSGVVVWWMGDHMGDGSSVASPPGPSTSLPTSASTSTSANPTPNTSIPTDVQAIANEVIGSRSGWAAWALFDRDAGTLVSSPGGHELNNSESVIKVWFAADYLKAVQEEGRPDLRDDEVQQLRDMIRHSANEPAQQIYVSRGRAELVTRMINSCGLEDTAIDPLHGDSPQWSLTQISPRDLARLGDCIVSKRTGLSDHWTDWLLNEMRNIDVDGSFGISPALPTWASAPAIKNGWTEHSGTGLWNLNCLAIFGPRQQFVLAIETHYAIALGQAYGAATCSEVTKALFPT